MKTCFLCKHCYQDMDNNYRCKLKSKTNIVCPDFGGWKINADKCKDYIIEN